MGKILRMPKRIHMSEDDMYIFAKACWGEDVSVPNMKGFDDFACEPNEGSFDFDKAASYDFPFYATSPEGVQYEAYGGWYNSNGHNFHGEMIFEEVIPQLTFLEELDKLKKLGMNDIPIDKIMEIYNKMH